MPFPLPAIPAHSYKTGGRRFGADRAHGRKHAGCDLLAEVGTPIYAVADGYVLFEPKEFYHGAWALAIRHEGYIARYCEFVKPTLEERLQLRPGKSVKAGQVIAHVGKMFRDSMLHFEVYAGTLHGELTVRKNKPFQRRADLLNPTDLLDKLRHSVQMSNEVVVLNSSLGVRL